MPCVERPDGGRIHYQIRGNGPINVLLLAGGGMFSSIKYWDAIPYNPWTSLCQNKQFRLIGMDQRNSNELTASPLGNGWDTYRDDQLAVLDHLKIEKCHTIGACIGPSFQLNLMKHDPKRFRAAVMFQPIGLSRHTTETVPWEGLSTGTRPSFIPWRAKLVEQDERFSDSEIDQLHEAMHGPDRDFVFSVDRSDVTTMEQPMLVFMGTDRAHPSETSREIVQLAKHATLVEQWTGDDYTKEAVDDRIAEFLISNFDE